MSKIDIQWRVCANASCFQATQALLRGEQLENAKFEEELSSQLPLLTMALEIVGARQETLFEHLIPLAPELSNNRTLAEVALRKTLGTQLPGDRIGLFASAFSALQSSTLRAMPNLIDEASQAGIQFRSTWERYAPRLLPELARLTDAGLVSDTAMVTFVGGIGGRRGRVFIQSNAVHWQPEPARAALVDVESMAHDTPENLPDLLQFAWLLSQLNLDLPRFAEPLDYSTSWQVGQLGLVAIVLATAESAQMLTFDEATLRQYLTAWHGEDVAESTTGTLWDWYHVYKNARPTWNVAVQALVRMLDEAAVPTA